MGGAITEKEVCGRCQADVRENTLFCYNCGFRLKSEAFEEGEKLPLAENSFDETRAALDDLTAKLDGQQAEDTKDRIAKAAAERKKARVTSRRPRQFKWEPHEDVNGNLLLLISVCIAVAALGIVYVTVYFK